MNQQIFHSLKLKSQIFRNEKYKERNLRLKKILLWVQNNEQAIATALTADFKKPKFETLISEILPIISELQYTIKNLNSWMKEKKVKTPFTLLGHTSKVRFENKGAVLIISPWNYPFQLSIAPLIAAVAAGNTAVIKPSELTPATSMLVKKLCEDCFAIDEVVVELGSKEKTEELLAYDFDHVFFTGSTSVGRIISNYS